MKKLVVGNWKMQKLLGDIEPYFHHFQHKVFHQNLELGLAVPSLFITSCLARSKSCPFMIGSQNVSSHDLGAYTGEIAALQLKSIPVSFCLVGHSERRAQAHESSSEVIKKAKKLQEVGILPIVCVGETLEEKDHFEKVLNAQLHEIFTLNPKLLVVAYEPVWAIGTGKTASLEDITKVHRFIKQFLKEGSYDFSSVRVLYGGSVNQANASEILNLPGVDGLLIGGASLDPLGFEKLIATLG